MDPTDVQFAAYRAMYAHFNRALFAGYLRPVILTFSRAANSLGFFAPLRWEHGEQTTHEISLNPAYLKTRSPRDVASTLVHEMVHLWQQEHGTPGKRGYHNEEWARKMEEIGLASSSTAAPGGKRVGYRMSHYIVEGAPSARAFEAMPPECLLPWTSWERGGRDATKPRPISKLKYRCPSCAANAWGKPGLSLRCGQCDEAMLSEATVDDDSQRCAA
jgi:hypothetical protein